MWLSGGPADICVRSIHAGIDSVDPCDVNVVNVEAGRTSYDAGLITLKWEPATETPTAETGTPQIKRTIGLHERPHCQRHVNAPLDDSAFNIDEWLAGRIADKFARSEAAAFVNGNGVDKPRGFLTASGSRQCLGLGQHGFVVSGADGDLPV
jgi:HK97 family phage major capsid protein